MVFLLFFIAVSVGLSLWVRDLWSGLNEQALVEIETTRLADNTQVLDARGQVIGEFFEKYHRFVPYEDLPVGLVHAIVAVEDRNFQTHRGFDPRGMFRALWVHLTRAPYSQGASTLTQQVVRHFLLTPEKTWDRKVREIFLSYKLEKRLSKQRIFEIYTNRLYLGNGAYGVGAAAQRHFSLPLEELNTAELAVIAGLFQSPSFLDPSRHPDRALARGAIVLGAMEDAGYLTPEERDTASRLPIRLSPSRGPAPQAPYFLDYVRTQAKELSEGRLKGEGLRIHTSLDPDIQKLVETAVRETDFTGFEGDKKVRIETAVLVGDSQTGQILAMVGGRDYAISQFNRSTQGKRSPGSLFKPIVYSMALAAGHKWSDVRYVSPITVRDYRPRDAKREFVSETTLLRAFYRSMNNPTIELSRELGMDAVLAQAQRMGITTPLKDEIGTALGGSAVTALDMLSAYTTLASGGRHISPLAISRIEDRDGQLRYQSPSPEERSRTVLTGSVAFLVTEGLRQVFLRGTGFDFKGMGQFSVGKTGTSNQGRDAWFAGFTPKHTVVVWMGTDDNQSLGPKASGATLALPLWARIVTALTPPPHSPPLIPPGILAARIHPLYGTQVKRGGVKMYFPDGALPSDLPSPLEALANQPFREWFE